VRKAIGRHGADAVASRVACQRGNAFFIEKSKREMIAEDLRAGLDLI